jgi:hypothetical protein
VQRPEIEHLETVVVRHGTIMGTITRRPLPEPRW